MKSEPVGMRENKSGDFFHNTSRLALAKISRYTVHYIVPYMCIYGDSAHYLQN